MEDTGRCADVQGFSESLGNFKDIPIGTCGTAIDIAGTQTTIIAVFHKSLYFGNQLTESLLNPNQCRAYGLTVNTCPKQFSSGKSMHGIHVPETDLFIPFQMHGCICYFSSRLPTEDELANCERVVFTSTGEWDPYAETFAEEDAVYRNITRGHTEVRLMIIGVIPWLSGTRLVSIIGPQSTLRLWPDVGGRALRLPSTL
jgi:hypothetical protein